MKVCFWVKSPLSGRDWKRFGFEVLQNRGIEVQCLDFTPLFNPRFWVRYGCIQKECPEVKTVHDHKEFDELMDQSKSAVVVDILCPGEGSSLANRLRQDAGDRRGDFVVVDYMNPVSVSLHPPGRLSKLWHIIKSGEWQRLIHVAMRSFGQTPPPLPSRPPVDLLICGGEMVSDVTGDHLDGAEILWAHTWDYDLYLEHREGRSRRQDYIVFLDSDMVFHSDYDHLNVHPFATAERYYRAMNQYFGRLEEDLGLPVIIAAHPRGRLERYPVDFQGREVVQGETAEMVRDAAYVVTHSSTSDSFAVLWNKPLLIVSTDELERSGWYRQMEATCKALGTQRMNTDRLPSKVDWQALAERPKARYDYFRNQLIKRDGTSERNSWELFADWLEQKETE